VSADVSGSELNCAAAPRVSELVDAARAELQAAREQLAEASRRLAAADTELDRIALAQSAEWRSASLAADVAHQLESASPEGEAYVRAGRKPA
jgi:hypothetical protein